MPGNIKKKEAVKESVKLEGKPSFNPDHKFLQALITDAFPSFDDSDVSSYMGYKLLKERASKQVPNDSDFLVQKALIEWKILLKTQPSAQPKTIINY